MECRHVTELLPWFVNKTLSQEEREQVREHLTGCDACRRELAQVLAILRAAGRHPTVEELTAHAFGLRQEDPVELERHLETCADCREQAELLRQSVERLHLAPVQPLRPAVVPAYWRVLAAAGMVLALVGLLLGFLAESKARRTAALYEAQITELKNQVVEAEQSRNLLVQEISPVSLTERDPTARQRLVIPAVSKEVTLSLRAGRIAPYPEYEVDLLAGTRVVWRSPGFVLLPTGDFTLSLPAAYFPDGESQLRLYGLEGERRVQVDAYALLVVRTASGGG